MPPALEAMATSAESETIRSLFEDALRYHQAGHLDAAEALYARILAQQRGHFDSLHLLGVCRHQRGDFAGAERQLRAALRVRPGAAAAHLNYGNALRELRRLDDAIASYRRATLLDPQLALAHYNLGTALEEQQRYSEALSSYERAIAGRGGSDPWLGRGNCLLALGRFDEAVAALGHALAIDPRNADAHANLGAALIKCQRFEEALLAVDEALSIAPGHQGAALNRAIVLTELGRPADALETIEPPGAAPDGTEALFQRARARARLRHNHAALVLLDQVLAREPRHWGARFERAAVLLSVGEVTQGQTLFDALLAERPDDVPTIFNRGLVALAQGDLARARRDMEGALAREPNLRQGRLNLAQLDLLEGRFESGWAHHEARWEDPVLRAHRRSFPQAVWLGQDDIGDQTLLVHAEQGAGDTVQFSRYLPLLRPKVGRLVFEVPRPMVGLMRRSLALDIDIVAHCDRLPPFDRHVPLMSLPYVFRTRLETVPAPVPYLRADPLLARTWRNRLGTQAMLTVGLAWSGNPSQAQDHARSIALSHLLPLLRAGGAQARDVVFVALQNQLRATDRHVLAQAPLLQYFGEAIESFDDTAALASLCDLVITVDTAPAHIAGALGKPVWVLLPFIPDSRWMLERRDSPWYPTARLFRQTELARWDGVLAEVQAALASLRPLQEVAANAVGCPSAGDRLASAMAKADRAQGSAVA
jgi:tetratricopeptide (TPR) repeat protein